MTNRWDKYKYVPPKTIEEAREKGRLPAVHAAPLWGMSAQKLARFLSKYRPPGAVKPGKGWEVTPVLMDKLGDQTFVDNIKKKAAKKI